MVTYWPDFHIYQVSMSFYTECYSSENDT